MGESSRRHADSSDEEDEAGWMRPSVPGGQSSDDEDEFGVSHDFVASRDFSDYHP